MIIKKSLIQAAAVGIARYSTKPIQSTTTKINNQTINYIKTGNGPNTVLCFPGALGTIWSDFKPQIENLDKNRFTIIAFDPPGYGGSRPPPRNFNVNFYNDDAKCAHDFMQSLNFEKYSILGWSDGGIAGMIMAAVYPENVQKLVVWGSNAYIVEEELKMYEKIRDISKWSEKMRAPLVEMYTEKGFQDMWNGWCDAVQEIFKTKQGDICKSLIKNITCPVFILHGDKDPMIVPEHPEYLMKHIKNSQIYRFPEGKHNVHLRYADEFNKLVTEFLLKN